MLNVLNHSLLLHKELSLAGDGIADQVIEAGLGLSYVDGLAGLVKENILEMDMAVAKSLGLETTPEVQAADVVRDRRFKSLRAYVEHKSYDDDERIAKEASFIYDIIRKHGLGLWCMGMSEQTVRLKALGNDFGSEKAQDALQKTGTMKVWVSLQNAQYEFEKILKKRIDEASAKEDPKVRISRGKLTNNLQALLLNLEVAQKLDNEADVKKKLAALVRKVNRIISSSMANARARITRANAKKTEKTAA
jgi:hypothetical protein